VQLLLVGVQKMIELVREPFSAAALLGLLLYLNWKLSLVLFVCSPIFIYVFSKSGKKVKIYRRRVQDNIGLLTHYMSEGVFGQKIIKIFGLQSYMQNRFHRKQDESFVNQMKSIAAEEATTPLGELFGSIALGFVLLFAHSMILEGELDKGEFLSFITALIFLLDPIKKFAHINNGLQQGRAAGERIFELIDQKIENQWGKESKIEFQNLIELKGISFKYEDEEVLKDINLKIERGKKTALVGSSGSGKSTLMSILLGLLEPQKGELILDGVRANHYHRGSWRSLFTFVGQRIFLFNDSLEENITFGKDIDKNDMKKAIEQSRVNEFLSQLPSGMETVLGERGDRLSGGQKQRITLARAFVNPAPILLLDEATSALDNESERLVQDGIENIGEDKTILAIAHRLSTIRDFDNIVVMGRGQIIEQGNHEQLMQAKGAYFKLIDLSSE
jgi:subfamily B ATP-binding cassette protein MsbA